MGRRAVGRFGQAGGAGAIGSEEQVADQPEQRELPPIDGGPDGSGAPPSFSFKYGDKSFSSEHELTSYLAGLAGEIDGLKRAQPAAPAVQYHPAPPAVPQAPAGRMIQDIPDAEIIDAILTRPKEVVGAIKNEIRQEFQQQEQSKKNIDNMWSTFWKQNKDLERYEGTVKMVFDSNMGVLGPMELDRVPAKLAELSRSAILSVNKDAFSGRQRDNTGRVTLEGTNTPSPPSTRSGEQPAPSGSLTSVIKQRAANRRKARNASTTMA